MSERLIDGAYVATLEGLAGSQHLYFIVTPNETSQPSITAGAGASVQLGTRAIGNAKTLIGVTFPATGANADGFTTTTLSFRQDDR